MRARTADSPHLRPALTIAVVLVLLALAGAAAAPGAVFNYRWQVQQGGAIGSSGYTANWPNACGAQPDIDNNVAPIVTTMSTAAYCGDDRVRNRRPGAPHEVMLLIKDTAYATSTTVTGQATGNRWALEDADGGGKTVRLTLGYAQGGAFTGWGFVDLVIPDGTNNLYLPDMSGISGTAPAGSHLALLVTKQVGANNSRVVFYFADQRQVGDQSGQISVDETAAGNTTTLGDGTDPAAASLCPGDAETVANQLTFVTDGNTDAVDDVTVSLSPAGSFNNLAQVRITTTGGSPLGTVNNPASDTLLIALTGLDATATETPYEVRITPKTHAAMPAPPGSSFGVTAPVTAFSPATNATAGSDNDTEATTVDNASPGAATWGAITPGNNQITLAWSDPGDADFQEVIIVRRQDAAVAGTPVEGQTYAVNDTLGPGETVVFVGTSAASPWTDTGVVNGNTYHYAIFARDACVNWSAGDASGPQTPQAPANDVTPGVPSATSVLCDSVTIQAPYTGDSNANSTTDFARGTPAPDCAGATYTAVTGCSGLGGASPRTCIDTTVAEQTDYCYQVTFNDVDGVNGTNPQTVGPVTTLACAADDTTVTANAADPSSCEQITTSSFFAGDDNGNGSTLVEYRTPPGSGGWTAACATLTGASPRQCLVIGLAAGTQYELQFTTSDVDGVAGPNPDTTAATTPACGGNGAPPTVLVLAPTRDAVVGGMDKVKIQVWDAEDLNPTVEWSVDGGAFSAASENTNYSCGSNCKIFEFDLDTVGLANGGHYFTVRATDAGTNRALVNRAFRVNNQGIEAGGGGFLLRRTHSPQLCIDCHNLPTHSSQATDTSYGNWAVGCLDCHTPHRTTNVFLIRQDIATPSSGLRPVRFETNASGAVADSSTPGSASFANEDNATQADGPCQACHTRTGGATARWRNAASGGNVQAHYSVGAGTQACTDCHTHAEGFRGSGECLDCHGDQTQGTAPERRAVRADFDNGTSPAFRSHHVGNGATMGGQLTSFDCVVCHAEGRLDTSGATPEVRTVGAYHGGDGGSTTIDLKDADLWDDATGTGTVYSYDKRSVCASVSGNDPACDTAGAAVTPANWHSGDSVWRTQTSQNLDPFCLSCHDSNGATASRNQNTDEGCSAGGSAQNPFCDAAITNNYDQQSRTAMVDIESKVSGSPPPQGQFSRHAIRGQSTSRYAAFQNIGGANDFTMYEGDPTAGQSLFTNMGTDEFGNPLWNDTSVMGCADCHTVDGANGSLGNAHGSGSEYLLKDASGTANEGTLGALTYVCYRCHVSGRYQPPGGPLGDHTDNDRDWQDMTGVLGTNRRDDPRGGSFFGMACMNCHGGAPGNGDPVALAFGQIHGTSSVYNVGDQGAPIGTRNAYRFMNGASLRFYDPNGWTGTAITCYTLTSGDNWGGCTQHNGGTNFDKPLQRPLNY